MRRRGSVVTLCAAAASVWLIAPAARGQHSVVGSPHDLSALGPGSIHALDEQQVCIFCHTPHNATGQWPLWNRYERNVHYRIYTSSTTDARIDQPSGPSKMCLSCHDGGTALGLVASRPETDPIAMTQRTIPPGPSDLAEDLSDDHPIGFRFDRALALRDRQLVVPDALTDQLPLGRHGEVHCTTCHDAHDNSLGNFLRETDRMSAICISCHRMEGWHASSHARSAAPVTGRTADPRELLPYGTVAENGCTSCHRIHSAPEPERLLRFRREEDNCLNCHSGGVAAKNIESEFRKRSVHPIDLSSSRHDADENPRRLRRRHVECVDCHNPHAVSATLVEPPSGTGVGLVGPTMRHVTGVDRFGNAVDDSRFEYEVCLKCHGDTAPRRHAGDIVRDIVQHNTRLEFQTNNPSFHPVFGARNSRDSVSLIPPLRPGSIIRCTDCHASDSPAGPGSVGAAGPHGSNFSPLLVANYETRAFTVESPSAYALCYQCHSRESILSNESFPGHRRHIVDGRTPCSACHDAHGISRTQADDRSHGHLINFDLNLVSPAGRTSPRIQFLDLGLRQGSCTLSCHGVLHVDFRYGDP